MKERKKEPFALVLGIEFLFFLFYFISSLLHFRNFDWMGSNNELKCFSWFHHKGGSTHHRSTQARVTQVKRLCNGKSNQGPVL